MRPRGTASRTAGRRPDASSGLLAEADRWIHALLETANDAFIAIDERSVITAWNPSAARMFGWTREEALGRSLAETVIPPGLREAHARGLKHYLATGEGPVLRKTIEISALRRDGTEFPVELTIWPMRVGDAVFFNAFARDVTDRRDAALAVKESEERHRKMFDRNPLPMWVLDQATLRFLAVNEAAVAQYGYSREEFLRMRLQDVQPADEGPAPRGEPTAVGPTSGPLHHLVRHRTRSGAILEVEIVLESIHVRGDRAWLVIARDVTERRRLEEQLRHAQKMEAVGTLAGGVAHDFNNLLLAILGFGDLAVEGLAADHPSRRHVEEILKAGERAATLTRQLLAFSRKPSTRPQVIDLNEVVREMERILRRLAGEPVEIHLRLDPSLGRTQADRGQVEQVLLNLVVNARDAMPAGGRLTIATHDAEFDDSYTATRALPRAGRYVVLSVTDTGIGFDRETRERLFEPFFTTKEVGKGTGLGLATVYGIVAQHGGGVWALGAPGAGATFKVCLPWTDAPLSPRDAAPAHAGGPGDRGSGTVLVAEDDDSVRALAVEVLRARGYQMLEAADGENALRIAQSCGRSIDLLVADVVMPRMGGRQLADSFRDLHPAAKVLYMTGFAGDAVRSARGESADGSVLQKPFAPADLARKVQEMLFPPGARD